MAVVTDAAMFGCALMAVTVTGRPVMCGYFAACAVAALLLHRGLRPSARAAILISGMSSGEGR